MVSVLQSLMESLAGGRRRVLSISPGKVLSHNINLLPSRIIWLREPLDGGPRSGWPADLAVSDFILPDEKLHPECGRHHFKGSLSSAPPFPSPVGMSLVVCRL